MEQLVKLRSSIQTVLADLSQGRFANGAIEIELICDVDRDRYLLIHVGWNGDLRVYECVVHIEIREGQVWIQRNQTDESLVGLLVEQGVDRDHIVIATTPPSYRELVENTVG